MHCMYLETKIILNITLASRDEHSYTDTVLLFLQA